MPSSIKRRKRVWVSFLLAILLLSISSCRGPNPPAAVPEETKDWLKPAPFSVQLERHVVTLENPQSGWPARFFYFPEVKEVMGGNNTGEIVGTLILDETKKKARALYLINPMESKADKITQVEADYEITNAALDSEWVVWVEKSEKEWKIYAKETKEGEAVLLDSGLFTPKTGHDFPSVSLDRGNLVYSYSLEDGKTMTSRVILHNLAKKQSRVLQEIMGFDDYLGAPSISGRYAVWHWGQWRTPSRSRVFLYDLESGKTNQVNALGEAISPKVWGNKIVFVGYDASHQETKNIFFYDIGKNNLKQVTDSKPQDLLEHCALPVLQ